MRDGLCVILVAGCWLAACAFNLCCTPSLWTSWLSVQGLSPLTSSVISLLCSSPPAPTPPSMSCSSSLKEGWSSPYLWVVSWAPISAWQPSSWRSPPLTRIFKALSTCGSHLFVVFLYYGTTAGVYYFPSSGNSKVKDSCFTPMLNPFIYSLRNKDMKHALQKFFRTMDTLPSLIPSLCHGHSWGCKICFFRSCNLDKSYHWHHFSQSHFIFSLSSFSSPDFFPYLLSEFYVLMFLHWNSNPSYDGHCKLWDFESTSWDFSFLALHIFLQ